MAKKLRVGDTVRGYRVDKVFGPGMMAISYGAHAPSGEKIFLKQYKSPSPAVVWYQRFVDYQHELATRVKNGKAAHYAVRLVETFEERWGGPTYFAAYEFVENGRGLEDMLEEERETHRRTRIAPVRDAAVWARHVTWAKVLMAGVAALHEAKIIHADLKPANAYLITDSSLDSGYQLKLIDTDFSVLADKRAPWHGHQGYVGTDNYRSPEHMTRGAVPILASDIFTCGLILHELLAGTHPYWQEDQAEYARLVCAHAHKPAALLGLMPAPASNAKVSSILHACLSPEPAARPSAAAIRAALSGRGPRPATATGVPGRLAPAGSEAGIPSSALAAAKRAGTHARSKLQADSIALVAPNGASLRISVRTEIGKAMLRPFGAEAEFWDDKQCTVERNPHGEWMVTPAARTVNETLVNGTALATSWKLSEGDVLAAGRSAKGISKLPLTVHVA